MEIHCGAQINSCRNLNVRTTIANSLTITSTNTENIYNADVWASCSSGCMNVFNCMGNITFYCGSTATPYPISFGDQCRNCLCKIPQNAIQYTKAIQSTGWDHCTPTPFPTINISNYYPYNKSNRTYITANSFYI
eukprot:751894_1